MWYGRLLTPFRKCNLIRVPNKIIEAEHLPHSLLEEGRSHRSPQQKHVDNNDVIVSRTQHQRETFIIRSALIRTPSSLLISIMYTPSGNAPNGTS